MVRIQLIKGDCLSVMDGAIAKGLKVDAIITDPPYGTTVCRWDSVIDIDEMFKRLKALAHPTTPIALFGSEPFSSRLRLSNLKNYRYDWVWLKNTTASFALAKKRPMNYHELISVFYERQCLYNPQFREYMESTKKIAGLTSTPARNRMNGVNSIPHIIHHERGAYPKMSIEIKSIDYRKRIHTTQKPVKLIEYLIKTYTNEGDRVLDFTAGSFTTAIACMNTGRNFVGIELDEKHYEDGVNRVMKHQTEHADTIEATIKLKPHSPSS